MCLYFSSGLYTSSSSVHCACQLCCLLTNSFGFFFFSLCSLTWVLTSWWLASCLGLIESCIQVTHTQEFFTFGSTQQNSSTCSHRLYCPIHTHTHTTDLIYMFTPSILSNTHTHTQQIHTTDLIYMFTQPILSNTHTTELQRFWGDSWRWENWSFFRTC